jgi:hypothetical protein
MEEFFLRIGENLFGRLDGPMHFRVIMQPLMAAIFAVIDGTKDAKNSKPAYFWAMISYPEHLEELIRDGWKSVGRIFMLAVILDIIYQLIAHHWIYPGEIIFVAIVLAIIPYLVMRGLANRVMRLFQRR